MKIAIVGCDGSGKTVFVSALSDYYQAGTSASQSCLMVPADTATRRYTDRLHRVMRIDRAWPEATSDIVGGGTLRWNLFAGSEKLTEIELMDFGGENFRYAFREDGPTANPEVVTRLTAYIAAADFVVITVALDQLVRALDLAQYRDLSRGDVAFDRDREAEWITDRLLKLVEDKVKTTPSRVVVALTQADKHTAELTAAGGAQALFARCWPMIASLHPNLNVVALASVDRLAEDGTPAVGFSTKGVLTVMEAFSRATMGDAEENLKTVQTLHTRWDEFAEGLSVDERLDLAQRAQSACLKFYRSAILMSEYYADDLKEITNFEKSLVQQIEELQKKRIDMQRQAAEAVARQEETRRTERVRQEKEYERRLAQARLAARAQRGRLIKRAFIYCVLLSLFAAGGWFGFKAIEQHRARVAEAKRVAERAAAEAAAKKAAEEAAARAAAEEAARQTAAREAEAAARAAAEEAARQAAAKKAAEEAKRRAAAEEAARRAAAKKAAEEAKRLAAQEAAKKAAEEEARQRALAALADDLANLEKGMRASNWSQVRPILERLEKATLSTADEEKVLAARLFLTKWDEATAGNAESMIWVGNQFYKSTADSMIVKNVTEAFQWYMKASAVGSAKGFFNCSLMLEKGHGCELDEARAGRYCLKAARLGYPEAMVWTGVYFMQGTHGFDKSLSTAYKFFIAAKAAGYKDSELDKLISQTASEAKRKTIDSKYPDDPEELPKQGFLDWLK